MAFTPPWGDVRLPSRSRDELAAVEPSRSSPRYVAHLRVAYRGETLHRTQPRRNQNPTHCAPLRLLAPRKTGSFARHDPAPRPEPPCDPKRLSRSHTPRVPRAGSCRNERRAPARDPGGTDG